MPSDRHPTGCQLGVSSGLTAIGGQADPGN